MKIFFVGDFHNNNGPANVNKNYRENLKYNKNITYSIMKNKITRILEIIYKISKTDIVLISGLSKMQLLACKIAKKQNKKVIYLMHGYAKQEYMVNEVPVEKRTLETIESNMLEYADKIVCVSENFTKFLINERKDLQKKITFVNNGIDMASIESKSKDNTTYTIISVGGGMKIKGNLNICKAIEKINNINIKFVVIGSKDKDGEQIEKYKFVQYYEKLEHNEVLNKMQQADLYIQNSKFETFGLAIFEAISKGCKILVSKQVGALSIIKNISPNSMINDTEDISEIEEKIRFAYKNKDENVKYIENYNQYTWSEAAKKLLEICNGDGTNEK